MHKLNADVTTQVHFYEQNDPERLLEEYGSPLYVYNERILRQNCRDMMQFCPYPHFQVNYSTKANSNLALLQIIRQEGLCADAMSPGEIHVELAAGFRPDQIFYISNNVSEDEMRYAIERNIMVSVDSLSQLERFGRINPGGRVALRFNPGVGAGHHEKVITAGKNTKFGINPEYIPDVFHILQTYALRVEGVNQHIGSLFMESDAYVESIGNLLAIAKQFPDLTFIDLGGGFGTPYRKQQGEGRLDLRALGEKLAGIMHRFNAEYGRELIFKVEPGRYIPAESGVLLGYVHAVKYNGDTKYVGCDIGFNVLVRPAMYGSHHDIEIYSQYPPCGVTEEVNIVGNICETGDILANKRMLPRITEGDILAVLDAGAYGFAMGSSYNNRLRPAEVLIRENGEAVLIRARESFCELMQNMKSIE